MTTRSRLEAELATRRYTRRHAREIVTAILGNNSGTVVAATDTRWYYIRLHGDPNQVVRAWNTGFVPPIPDLPVDIEIIKANGITDYQIIGVSLNRGVAADVNAGATGSHALQHQRRDFNTGGFDPLDIYGRAIVQLRARAQATPDMTLYVEPGWFSVAGIATYFAGGNSPAFTAPAGGSRCDLLYLDNTSTLQIVTGTVAPLGTPTRPAQPTADDLPLAYVYVTAATTSITEYLIEDGRMVFGGAGGGVGAHDILSATHSDALVGTVVDGDIIIGNVTPKWSRLAIAIPAANVRNVLGIDNGELRPSWKTALDATAAGDIASAGAAGTSLVFAHRDHAHRGVVSVNKNGGATLYGAVTLSAGANVTLTQTGQDIAIASTSGGSLTVQEVDTSPSVANVNTIIVPNGSLTDNGGGSVTFTPAGTGDVVGPGSATDGHIALFDGATGKLIKDGGAYSTTPSHAYFTNLAALLEPLAIEPIQIGAFSYAVSAAATKYLLASYNTRIGASGKMEVRDPRSPLALSGITLVGIDATAAGVLLDPTAPTYTDAWTTYYDRLAALATTTPQFIPLTAANTPTPLLPGAYGAIILNVTDFDGQWVAINHNGLGWNLANEESDTATQRNSNNLMLPISKLVCSEVRTSTNNFTSGGILYVLMPSTWGKVTDATSYDFRDDFMGASLNTAATWTRAQSTVGNVEINTLYQWLKMVGNNSWATNGCYSQSSIARANGKVFMCDVYVGRNGASPNLMVGFSDGGGQNYTNMLHAVYFTTTGGANRSLNVFEAGTSRGAVGSGYTEGYMYRVRITASLTNNNAAYAIQGGTEYQAIGGSTWTDITPGTTSNAGTPLYAGMTLSGNATTVYVGDVKMY